MASVYLRCNDRILLLHREGSSIVQNLWIGSAGGHFEEFELRSAKDCVLRELKEELGLSHNVISNLSLRYVTLRYADNELRQNYYFFADYCESPNIAPPSNEGTTRWFSIRELSQLPMPFTARYMLEHYLAEGQFNDLLYGGIANNTGVTFYPL